MSDIDFSKIQAGDKVLRMVLDADGLALLPGWENSRGATLEVHVAKALNLHILPLDEWLTVEATS